MAAILLWKLQNTHTKGLLIKPKEGTLIPYPSTQNTGPWEGEKAKESWATLGLESQRQLPVWRN